MKEIPVIDHQTTDFHRYPRIDNVHIGMGRDYIGGKEMKSQRLDFIQITDPPVGYHPETAEGLMNVGIDFPPEGADAAGLIEIMDDRNPWPRYT